MGQGDSLRQLIATVIGAGLHILYKTHIIVYVIIHHDMWTSQYYQASHCDVFCNSFINYYFSGVWAWSIGQVMAVCMWLWPSDHMWGIQGSCCIPTVALPS